jgi:hypothetical protein
MIDPSDGSCTANKDRSDAMAMVRLYDRLQGNARNCAMS